MPQRHLHSFGMLKMCASSNSSLLLVYYCTHRWDRRGWCGRRNPSYPGRPLSSRLVNFSWIPLKNTQKKYKITIAMTSAGGSFNFMPLIYLQGNFFTRSPAVKMPGIWRPTELCSSLTVNLLSILTLTFPVRQQANPRWKHVNAKTPDFNARLIFYCPLIFSEFDKTLARTVAAFAAARHRLRDTQWKI